MNALKSTVPLLTLPLAVCAACDPGPTSERESSRVLVFSRTMGYRHASIEPGIEAIRAMGRTGS